MYICIHVYMYICICIHVYVYMYVRVCLGVSKTMKYVDIYIYIWYPPQDRPFCCLDFFDTYPTCNGVAMPLQVGWIQDSRFKILTGSFQQILNPGFKIQDSQRLF